MPPNSELIKLAIEKYISTPDTDYAIMISGKWGVGKTYFVKSVLNKILTSKKLKLCYVSLYGLSTCKEINHAVFTSVYPFTGTTSFKIGKAVAETVLKKEDISFAAHDLDFPIKDSLLLFDDLERVSKIFSVNDVLGCLNKYIENKKIKTIIICDENHLAENPHYIITKEKIVRFSHLFNPDNDYTMLALSAMAGNFHVDIKPIIDRNRGNIEFIMEAGCCNLRTMHSAISMVAYVYGELRNSGIIPSENYIDAVLKCFIGYLNEINQRKSYNLDWLVTNQPTAITIMFHGKNSSTNTNGNIEEDETEIDKQYSYAKYFYSRYFPVGNDPYLSAVAYEICKTGVCNVDDLGAEYLAFEKSRLPKTPFEKLVNNLWKLEDHEVEIAVDEALNKIKECNVENLNELLRMLENLHFLSENNLTEKTDTDMLLAIGISCVDKIASDDGRYLVEYMRNPIITIIPIAARGTVSDQILAYAKEKASLLFSTVDCKVAEELWARIASGRDEDSFTELFSDNSRWATKPFFSYMDTKLFIEKTLGMNSQTIFAITGAIERRYQLFSETSQLLSADQYPLERLGLEIDEELNKWIGKTKPLTIYALELLRESLTTVLPILRPIQNNEVVE